MQRNPALPRRALLAGALTATGCASLTKHTSRPADPSALESHRGFLVPGYQPGDANIGLANALENETLRRNLPADWDGPLTMATRLSPAGEIERRALMPIQGHQICARPDGRQALFVGMNDVHLLSFDPATLDLAATAAPHREGFVFGGHAVFLPDRKSFLVTERLATKPWQGSAAKHHGVVTRRDSATLAVLDRFTSHGIAPHEIDLMADGRHLAIAHYGSINPTDYESRADIRGGSLVVMELANGRLVHSIAATRAEFEVRHLAAHALDRIAVIQARQAPLDEAAADFRPGDLFWEADPTVADPAFAYLPAPLMLPHLDTGDVREVTCDAMDSRQGQSIIYDPRHDEYLATFASPHRLLIVDGPSGRVKKTIATDRLGLRLPRGIALIPGSDAYAVTGSWNGLMFFERGRHRPLPERSRLDLVFYNHSHLTVC